MRTLWALIRWELWQRRWALLWWAVGVVALVAIDMLLYRSIKDETAQLNDVYASLPATVRVLFSDTGNFLSPVGYLSARVYYLLLPVLLSIFTIGLGAKLIGREEQQGTLDVLLAKPVTRTKLLAGKLIAGAAALSALGVAAFITAALCLRPSGFSDISYLAVAKVTLAAVLLAALFGMLAFTLAAFGRPLRSAAAGIAALFAFAGYIAASLESVVSGLRWPAKLLPYHYYQPSAMLAGAGNQKWQLCGFAVVLVILAVASWVGFRRRDIA